MCVTYCGSACTVCGWSKNGHGKAETKNKRIKAAEDAVLLQWFIAFSFCVHLCVCVPEWEINKGVQFIPHVTTVGEAFQMDHQHRRQRPQVQLLSGLLVLLTVWTVPARPHVILADAAGWCRHLLVTLFVSHQGSSAPSFSFVVNSSMQSFSLKKAFFWGLYSMLSCLSKSCKFRSNSQFAYTWNCIFYGVIAKLLKSNRHGTQRSATCSF